MDMQKYLETLKEYWYKNVEIEGYKVDKELQVEVKKDTCEEYGEIRYEGIFIAQITYAEDETTFEIRLAQLSKIIDDVIEHDDIKIKEEIETVKYICILYYLIDTVRAIKETSIVLGQV